MLAQDYPTLQLVSNSRQCRFSLFTFHVGIPTTLIITRQILGYVSTRMASQTVAGLPGKSELVVSGAAGLYLSVKHQVTNHMPFAKVLGLL